MGALGQARWWVWDTCDLQALREGGLAMLWRMTGLVCSDGKSLESVLDSQIVTNLVA